jgi:protein-arginine kinase activator protein McsA
MQNRRELRYTLMDQFGSRAVIESDDLDRTVENWGFQKFLENCYDSEPTSSCPACGTTLTNALASGLMGCPACYAFIYPQYQEALRAKGLDSNLSQSSLDSNQVS